MPLGPESARSLGENVLQFKFCWIWIPPSSAAAAGLQPLTAPRCAGQCALAIRSHPRSGLP